MRNTARATASTWFQTALEGGRISRVPLTALIMISRPLAYTRGSEARLNHNCKGVALSSRLVPVYPRGFHVTVGILAKALALFFCYGSLHLGGHPHHHAEGWNLGALRHHRAGRNHGALPDLGAVQNHGCDSEQALVLDGAPVQHHHVPHRDAIADMQRKPPGVARQHRIVLNVGFIADANHVDVTPRGDVGPDAGAFADHHVSNHLRALIDVSRSGDLGYDAAIGTNHDCGVSLNRSTRAPPDLISKYNRNLRRRTAIFKTADVKSGNHFGSFAARCLLPEWA